MKAAFASLAIVLALSGCATQSQLPGNLRGSYSDLSARDAALANYQNQQVRWGGRIIQIEPKDNRTCFEIVAARLDTTGRPDWHDETGSRFIACRNGFHDPSVFRINRDVTFTGTITGYEDRVIVTHDYRFPKLEADTIHLWPERTPAKRKSNNRYFWWI